MIRFLLIAFAVWGVLLTLILLVGAYLQFTSHPDNPRRVGGRCAVPGCGKPAGHWIHPGRCENAERADLTPYWRCGRCGNENHPCMINCFNCGHVSCHGKKAA